MKRKINLFIIVFLLIFLTSSFSCKETDNDSDQEDLLESESTKCKDRHSWDLGTYTENEVLYTCTICGEVKNEEISSKEQFIYFDKVLSDISFLIYFNYPENDGTKQKLQEFATNSGLNNFNYEHIFYYKIGACINLFFNPEEYTSEIDDFILSLDEKYYEVTNIIKEEFYRYSSAYAHNPKYYGLTNEDKILYLSTNTFILPTGIYTSNEDIQNGINNFFEENPNVWVVPDERNKLIEKINNTYNEEYFKDNVLIIPEKIVTGSGSNKQELTNVYYKDNNLYVFVNMYFASIGTGDLQITKFAISINRDLINDIDNLNVKLMYKKDDVNGLW